MIDTLVSQLMASSPAELAAVVLAVAYLVLAVRENIWCWACALASTAIFLVVFWDVNLYMESGLQVYYIVMAVYGWWAWTHGGTGNEDRAVTRWTPAQHGIALALIALATLTSGWLQQGTDTALPYLDAFTTWASVLTTWMVAQKILENWIYWFVIDSVSIYLYLDRELYFTALLFAIYLVIIIFGWRSWYRSYTDARNMPL